MEDDWEHNSQLSKLFPTTLSGQNARETPFSDAEFEHMSQILDYNGQTRWSKVPRTYAILRLVESRQYLDRFIDMGITDISIPYTRGNLPSILPPFVSNQILEVQQLVYTNILNLERGVLGKHITFESRANLRFQILGQLGKGGCGRVEKVFSNVGQKTYAMKLISRSKVFKRDKTAMANFVRELQASKKVEHHHIVKVVGSFTEHAYVGIIMETVADQDLESFLQMTMDRDKESLLRTFFGCLASGLVAIHDAQIRHKDIKPRNILIKNEMVLFTDFGLALDFSQIDRSTTKGPPTMFTARYCAPEVAEETDRNTSSDIFSLGLCFLEMTTRLNGQDIASLREFSPAKTMSHSNSSLKDSAMYCKNLPNIRKWIESIKSMPGSSVNKLPLNWIMATLEENPKQRPTARELWDVIDEDTTSAQYAFCCRICAADHESVASSISSSPPSPVLTSATPASATLPSPITPLTTPPSLTPPPSTSLSTSLHDGSGNVELDRPLLSPLQDNDRDTLHYQSPILPLSQPASFAENGGTQTKHTETSQGPLLNSTNSKTMVGATKTVHKDIVDAFKKYSAVDKMKAREHQRSLSHRDKAVRLNDLKNFAKNFTLSTEVPMDLVPILAKDKKKQQDIVDKAKKMANVSRKLPSSISSSTTSMNQKLLQSPLEERSRSEAIIMKNTGDRIIDFSRWSEELEANLSVATPRGIGTPVNVWKARYDAQRKHRNETVAGRSTQSLLPVLQTQETKNQQGEADYTVVRRKPTARQETQALEEEEREKIEQRLEKAILGKPSSTPSADLPTMTPRDSYRPPAKPGTPAPAVEPSDWTGYDDTTLQLAVSTVNPLNWNIVAKLLDNKFSRNQCRKRYKILEKRTPSF
jgi:serine/threonine protein kinase